MAETANTLVDAVLARVRDPQGAATSRERVRRLLSNAQRIVNLAVPGVLTEASFTAQPRRLLYDVDEVAADVARVERIVSAGRDLVRSSSWRHLAQADRRWVRAVGTAHKLWVPLGREHFLLWPSLHETRTITVVYTTLTTDLSAESTPTDVRDDRLPAVLALTEALVLARMRLFDRVPDALAQFVDVLGRLPRAGGSGVADFAEA